jgi:hypothetical protein
MSHQVPRQGGVGADELVVLVTEMPRRLKCKPSAYKVEQVTHFQPQEIAPTLKLSFVNNSTLAVTTISQSTCPPLNSRIRGLFLTDFPSPLFSCCILCPVSHLIGTLQRPPWTGNPSPGSAVFPSSLPAMRRLSQPSSTIPPFPRGKPTHHTPYRSGMLLACLLICARPTRGFPVSRSFLLLSNASNRVSKRW